MVTRIRLVQASLALGTTLALSPPAYAQRFDEVSFRADCAQIELDQATGAKVTPEDAARCADRPRPPPPAPKPPPPAPGKNKGAGRDGYFVPKVPTELPELPAARPTWLDGKASEGKVLYGVGLVTKSDRAQNERLVAMQRATFEIAAQIQTTIDSASVDVQSMATVEATGANGKTKSASITQQAFSSTTQMLVQASIEGLKFVGHYRDAKNGNYYVLASLDQGELERQQDAVVEAVVESMAVAAEAVVEGFRRDELSHELIFGLADALDQANTVGRSPIGRKVKDRWKNAQEQLKRTAQRLASCVDVKGGYLEANPAVLELRASCGGKPLRGARFIGRLEGGLADVPPSLVANREGVVRFTPGTVFGKETVKLTLVSDLQGLRAAAFIGEPRPSQRATIDLPAAAPALAKVSFVGLDESPEAEKLKDAVAGLVERKLGIQVAEAGTLKVIATVSLGSSVGVGAQTTQPIELNVTVAGPRGRLYAKSARTAGLAGSPLEAKRQAMQRVTDGMRTW